ncbi:restriction endonuclease subunit S [Streptomyces sp. Inha503]|uniref:restriction endonuclease subunit S n=1 Tax=Streptomyces sp. Inha503 TaxID=3383314 RepID=UPI0039A2032C
MRGEAFRKEVPLSHYLSGPIRNGFSPPESQDWTGVQMLGLGCLTPDGFHPRQLKNAPPGISPDHPALLSDGDILVSRANTRALVGLAGRYRDIGSPCIYPDLMMRLRPSELCLSDFLEVLLKSSPVRRRIMASAQGTSESMVKISANMVRDIPVPLVPLAEQHRIISALKETDKQVTSEIHKSRKEQLLWEGVLNHELDQHVRNFEKVRLADVTQGGGQYGSSSPAVPYSDSLPRYVRITDIDDHGTLLTDSSTPASIPWEKAHRHILSSGDLLIARTGFTTGKSYLYYPTDGTCAYAGYLVRYRIKPDVMLPEYAFAWSRSNAFHQWVNRSVREVGQRNISAREYDRHLMPLAPLSTQRQLVKAWEAARSVLSLSEQKINGLKMLKQALIEDLLTGKAT